ncbi:MAG: HAMP domain-containing protein [Caulobacter sp.]|nr:HAMP domain-containing protein [Caulobacter sp.]
MKIRPLRMLVPRGLKRWLPQSLFARTLLIIVLPVAIMQGVVTWIFFDQHWQTVTSGLSDGLAGDVAWIAQTHEANPGPANLARLAERAEKTLSLSVKLVPGKTVPERRPSALFAPEDRALNAALERRLDAPFWVDNRSYNSWIGIRVLASDGVLKIYAPRERAFATSAPIFILWMAVATLLLTAIAILFIRNQVRAIERLAAAADAFGRGIEGPEPFKPYGAREVRQAAQAFLSMKARIQRHIEQRTVLLASVSHDLRTPLTRLKLEMALAEPSDRTEAIKRDLAEMEHMIDEYLEFARGEGGEAVEFTDVAGLLTLICDDARRAGATVELAVDAGLTGEVRPNALKRAVDNLVANAAGHADRVRVTGSRPSAGGLEIAVDDDGPGIPADKHEEAFKPFSRLDDSRNQNRKGVGLGLAIARDVARGHGGEVFLSRSTLGGLKAVIRLPG